MAQYNSSIMTKYKWMFIYLLGLDIAKAFIQTFYFFVKIPFMHLLCFLHWLLYNVKKKKGVV